MFSDPLRHASSELRRAVDAMGGLDFLAAIDRLVHAKEERTISWCDEHWDDLAAEEIFEWTLERLAHTGPGVAHAEVGVVMVTYPHPYVESDDGEHGQGWTTCPAFVRVRFGRRLHADRYALGFASLEQWVVHDAVRFEDGPPHRHVR